jgi:hypothetical protein
VPVPFCFSNPVCFVADLYEPPEDVEDMSPDEEEANDLPIQSAEELARLLRHFASKEPRLVLVRMPNGVRLFIGIGRNVAVVRVFPDGRSPLVLAPRPDPQYSPDDLWVVAEGQQSSYHAYNVMSLDNVIEIVKYIVERDELPNFVRWADERGNVTPIRRLDQFRNKQ